jgi:hypothetical protein
MVDHALIFNPALRQSCLLSALGQCDSQPTDHLTPMSIRTTPVFSRSHGSAISQISRSDHIHRNHTWVDRGARKLMSEKNLL